MKLRQWQSEFIELALLLYLDGYGHFLTLVTLEASKTLMLMTSYFNPNFRFKSNGISFLSNE